MLNLTRIDVTSITEEGIEQQYLAVFDGEMLCLSYIYASNRDGTGLHVINNQRENVYLDELDELYRVELNNHVQMWKQADHGSDGQGVGLSGADPGQSGA